MTDTQISAPATFPVPEPPESSLLPIASAPEVRSDLRRRMRPNRGAFLLGMGILAAGTAVALISPRLIGEIVDRVLAGGSKSVVTAPAVGLLVVAIVAGILDGLGRALIASSAEEVLAGLREDVIDSALSAGPDRLERAGSGDVISRVSGDVEQISDLAGGALSSLLRSGLVISLTLVGLAALDWRLALAALVAVPVQALALRWYLGVTGPMYAAERVAEGARAQEILTSVRGASTVRAYGLAEQRLSRIRATCADAMSWAVFTTRQNTRFFGRLNLAELLGVAGVLSMGFVLVREEIVSVGDATAAALYFIGLFGPINTFLAVIDDAQEAGAGLARLVGVTQLPPRLAAGTLASPVDSTVVIAGVGHSYVPGHPVLHDVHLTLRPGERVALVGSSGAGKTTLARLVAGMNRTTTGAITIGGVAVADLDPAAARRAVVLVTQESHTFAGTLADDLRVAKPGATDAELAAALDIVGASGWVAALPHGLATLVGAGGQRLAPAAAQQVALARLFLVDPLVAVLDEATAEAGSVGAATLEQAADRVLRGRTALIVAHRLSQAVAADRVVVLEGGRVVEEGTHEELAAGTGPYSRLWSAWARYRPT